MLDGIDTLNDLRNHVTAVGALITAKEAELDGNDFQDRAGELELRALRNELDATRAKVRAIWSDR